MKLQWLQHLKQVCPLWAWLSHIYYMFLWLSTVAEWQCISLTLNPATHQQSLELACYGLTNSLSSITNPFASAFSFLTDFCPGPSFLMSWSQCYTHFSMMKWRQSSDTVLCSHYFLTVNHLHSELKHLFLNVLTNMFFRSVDAVLTVFLSEWDDWLFRKSLSLPVNAYWAWILHCLGRPHVCSVICTLSPCYFCTNPVGFDPGLNRCGSRRAKRHHDGGSCLVTGYYVGKLTEILEESEVSWMKL